MGGWQWEVRERRRTRRKTFKIQLSLNSPLCVIIIMSAHLFFFQTSLIQTVKPQQKCAFVLTIKLYGLSTNHFCFLFFYPAIQRLWLPAQQERKEINSQSQSKTQRKQDWKMEKRWGRTFEYSNMVTSRKKLFQVYILNYLMFNLSHG